MKTSRKMLLCLLCGLWMNLAYTQEQIFSQEQGSVEKQKRLFSSSIKESLKEAHRLKTKRQLYWTENYIKASKISQEKHKYLLLAFVGSDWCPWSQKLENEVLTQAPFTKPLKDDFIFVWVDFPENASLSAERNETNQFLKEKYHVTELPTLVLLDEMGEEISTLGYLPFEPENFASYIRGLIADYKELQSTLETSELSSLPEPQLESLYHKAQNIGCQKRLEEILQAGLKADQGTFFLLEQYEKLLELEMTKDFRVSEIRKRITSRDPKNIYGTHLKLAMIEFKKNSNHPGKKDKPHAAIEPLVEYIKEFGKIDVDNRWRVEMTIAQYFFSKGVISKALQYALASYDSAPEGAKAEIALSIDYLKTQQTYP